MSRNQQRLRDYLMHIVEAVSRIWRLFYKVWLNNMHTLIPCLYKQGLSAICVSTLNNN